MKKILSLFAFVAIVFSFAACGGNDGNNPEVIVQGKFTVGNGKQVYFSKGNLQVSYDGSKYNWTFAENQWDFFGAYGFNGADLFGWSTLSTEYGLSTNEHSYYYYGDFYDWGHVFPGAGWRTLSSEEWVYLFHERPMAEVMFAFGHIVVDNTLKINGVIILPDNWTKPEGVSFTPSTQCEDPNLGKLEWDETDKEYVSSQSKNYEHNEYTLAQWSRMERAGAIFLPAAGYRSGVTVKEINVTGCYWASDFMDDDNSYYVYFYKTKIKPQAIEERYYGQSVRLVRNVQ